MTGDGCSWTGVTCDGNGRVTQINLVGNNLSGSMPASLGNLAMLQALYLDSNPKLGSTFPDIFYRLTALSDVTASACNFSGTLPFVTGPFTATLQEVDFSQNKFSGSIPAAMAGMSGLKYEPSLSSPLS